MNLEVGDIVMLHNNEHVPVSVCLVHSPQRRLNNYFSGFCAAFYSSLMLTTYDWYRNVT